MCPSSVIHIHVLIKHPTEKSFCFDKCLYTIRCWKLYDVGVFYLLVFFLCSVVEYSTYNNTAESNECFDRITSINCSCAIN